MNKRLIFSNSYIESIDGIDYLKLEEENYYKTGYAAGKLFVESKNGLILFFKNPIVQFILRVLYFLKKRRMKEIRVPEQYQEELRGLSDSMKIKYKYLLLANLIYEIRGCSGFAFFNKDSTLLMGHNTDTATFLARFLLKKTKPLVTRVSIPGKNIFTHVSLPGFFGVIDGFNDKGIAISSHDVGDVYHKVVRGNISASCLLRLVLENAKNLEDVARIIRDNLSYIPGLGLVASEREKKMAFVELYPTEANIVVLNQKCAYVANHYMSSRMQKYHKNVKKGSLQRLACLEECFSKGNVSTVTEAITILQDHRNGIHRDTTGYSIANEGTFQSFVFDVTRGDVYISNGNKTPVSLYGNFVKISTFL